MVRMNAVVASLLATAYGDCPAGEQPIGGAGGSGCEPCPEHHRSREGDEACRLSLLHFSQMMRDEDDDGTGAALRFDQTDADRKMRISLLIRDLPAGPLFGADEVEYQFDMGRTQNDLVEASACNPQWRWVDDTVYDDVEDTTGWQVSMRDSASDATTLPASETYGPFGEDVDHVHKIVQLTDSSVPADMPSTAYRNIPADKTATVSAKLFFTEGFSGEISLQNGDAPNQVINLAGSETDCQIRDDLVEGVRVCSVDTEVTDVPVATSGEMRLKFNAANLGSDDSFWFQGLQVKLRAAQVALEYWDFDGVCKLNERQENDFIVRDGFVKVYLVAKNEPDHTVYAKFWPIRIQYSVLLSASVYPLSIWVPERGDPLEVTASNFETKLELMEENYENVKELEMYQLAEYVYVEQTLVDPQLSFEMELVELVLSENEDPEVESSRGWDLEFVAGEAGPGYVRASFMAINECNVCYLHAVSRISLAGRRLAGPGRGLGETGEADGEAEIIVTTKQVGIVKPQLPQGASPVTKDMSMTVDFDPIAQTSKKLMLEKALRTAAVAAGEPLGITKEHVIAEVSLKQSRRLREGNGATNVDAKVSVAPPESSESLVTDLAQRMDSGLTLETVNTFASESFEDADLPAPEITGFSAAVAIPPTLADPAPAPGLEVYNNSAVQRVVVFPLMLAVWNLWG